MNPPQSPTNPHAAGKAAHTPRFYTDGSGLVYDRENAGRVYATAEPDGFDENTAPETAAFIVRACNSHAALLAFAKTFALWDSKGIIKTLAPYEGNEGGLRELARAALQSANLEAAQ